MSMRKLLTALLWLPIGAVSAQRLDADNVSEAFGMMAVDSLLKEHLRRFCGERLPDQKAVIDSWFYTLSLNNESESLALESHLRRLSEADRRKFEDGAQAAASEVEAQINASTPAQGEAYCVNTVTAIESGAQDFSTQSPRASAYLAEYAEREGLAPQVEDEYNFVTGCIKRGMNDEADLDFLFEFCPCNRRAFGTLSASERSEFESRVRAEGSAAGNALPQIVALRTRLEQCAVDAAAAAGLEQQ